MATRKIVITSEQYRVLQNPIVPPNPQNLLDFQLETLVAKKLMAYADADPFRKDLPSGLFILVPPKPKKLDLDHLMSLVVVDGRSGANYLDPQYLNDEVDVPLGVYLMEGVEDGASRLDIKPSVNQVNILRGGRSPLTTFEGIVLATIFPDVLKHHYMDLVGSRCESGGRPHLYLDGAEPRLGADWLGSAVPEWGAPSCLRRRFGR